VVQFDRAIQAGDDESLRGAVGVYRGPLLEDCLEEWAFSERAARAEQFLAALETLAERAAGRGEHPEAIRYLREAQALDPLRDSLVQRLMTSLAAAGDPAAAIQSYRDFRVRLQEELAAAPAEVTTRVFQEIRAAARHQAVQRRLAPGPVANPATGDTEVPPPVPEPLPRPLTSLIGRDQELEQIRESLRQGRLVTLVGGGGVGKTRLALEIALQAGGASPDGAAWVELGPLADGALVLPSVAAALGIRDKGGAQDVNALTRRLVARLADGAPLLVLDNCEHLLDATAAVVQMLLQRCPGLRVLATSQQRLGLPGEVAWRVPSLSVPGVQVFGPSGVQEDRSQASEHPNPPSLRGQERSDARGGTPEHLMQYAAVRLFVERATAVHPGFRLASSAEADAVGLICRRLDGIPLAIELAAARARVLTPQQIAARLDDRFALLTRGTRGAVPRHQTLRALIDWSYDSLPAAEAALLRRLSVFAGGWTLEAAEAIGGSNGTTASVLDILDSLVDRSLVLVDEVAQGLRYRLLETVREYAREKLEASGELTATRNQHRDWFLHLATQADAAARGPEQKAHLTQLSAEIDNLRAALAWCLEAAGYPRSGWRDPSGDAAEVGLRLADALYWLWIHYGYLTEGSQWLERALVSGSGAPTSPRAHAFFRAAQLARHCGERERSISLLQSARQGYEEVLTLARTVDDQPGIAAAVLALADVTHAIGSFDAAWSYGAEARQRMAELGDRIGLVSSLEVLSVAAVSRGDHRAARSLLEERLAQCRELGASDFLIHALGAMAHRVRDEGDYAQARSLYSESLGLRRELGDRFAVAQSLEDLAVLAGREQRSERAARLLGAGEAYCETLGARPPVAMAAEYERTVAEGRAALGEAVFAAAWNAGRAMSLDEAVEYAFSEPGSDPMDPRRPPR
jgi:predicted ATPase